MEERGGCGPTRAAAGPLSTAGLGCTGHGATNRAAGGVGTLLSRPAHHQLATGRARRRRLRRRSVAAAPAASRTRPSPPPCSRVLRLTPRRNGGTSAGEGLGGSVRTVRVVARPLPCTDRPGGPGDPPAVPGLCTDRRPAPLPRPPPLPRQPPTAQSRPPEKGALVRAREATGGSRLEQTTPSCCYHCRRRCRRRRCRRHHRSRHSRRRDSRPWRCH